MPIDYRNYAPAWKTEIRPAILRRARDRCEWCGVPNGAYRNRLTGEWTRNPEQVDTWNIDGERHSKIVLTVAHLDHDVGNNSEENLRALCHGCHLGYDARHHAATARKNRESRSGQLRFF